MEDAPLKLRYLARFIDVTFVLGVIVTAILVAVGASEAFQHLIRRRGVVSWNPRPRRSARLPGNESGPAWSQHLSVGLIGALRTISLQRQPSRLWGSRWLGVRRVDARTGGELTVRSLVVGEWFDEASREVSKALLGSRGRRHAARMREIAPIRDALEKRYPDDPSARQEAVRAFNQNYSVSISSSVGWAIARMLTWHAFLSLGTRRRRTVRDRVTGTRVIHDHR